jgi:hypothetical protein
MGNPHKRKKNYRRRRKSNPRRKNYSMRHNAHRVRHLRRRRNPSLNRATIELVIAGGVGAVATRAGTQAILGDKNAGVLGYGSNALAAFLLGYAGERFVNANVGTGLMVGGLIGLVLRVAKEQFFASSPLAAQLALSGLGDADFALSGYVQDQFTLPTTSDGPDQLTVTPNSYWNRPVVVAPAKGMQGYDAAVIDRWRTPWGR